VSVALGKLALGGSVAETGPNSELSNPDYVTVEQRVLQDNINLVDAKSGILMAISGGLIARDLDKFFELATTSHGGVATTASLILYGAALVGFFFTGYFTWFVLRPRLIKTNDYVYWGSDVFLASEKHYIDTVSAASATELRQHFLHHVYVLALVCRKKFAFFVNAMRAAEISLLLTLAAEVTRYISYAPPDIHTRIVNAFVSLVHRLH
jgi:hypothetical protein